MKKRVFTGKFWGSKGPPLVELCLAESHFLEGSDSSLAESRFLKESDSGLAESRFPTESDSGLAESSIWGFQRESALWYWTVGFSEKLL